MSSKAIQERRDGAGLAPRWQAPRERAPSEVREVEPWLPRLFGVVGLFLFVLGVVVLLLMTMGRSTLFHFLMSAWVVNTLAVLAVMVGLGGMLIHAASDADFQIRRTYMVFGFAWIVLGLAASLIPESHTWAPRLHPLRLPMIFLGLMFLLAFLRNETEADVRQIVAIIIGVLGGLAAVGGFLFGSIYNSFLLDYGIHLTVLLGLPYLLAFLASRGESDELTQRVGLAMGAVGLLFFLIAFFRSAVMPALAGAHVLKTYTPYLMPYGLIMMTAGLLYVLAALSVCSDRQLVVLTRRELAAIFYSPIAYVVLVGMATIAGILFLLFFVENLWRIQGDFAGNHAITLSEPIVRRYFVGWAPIICLMFVVPVLTMRLFSEEHRAGTLEMALTAPIDETVIVVSKLLAALAFFMVLWLPFGFCLRGLKMEGVTPFDYTPVLAFYVVLLVTGASFLSMGIFFSSLTSNQIAAAILAFVGILLMTLIALLQGILGEYLGIAEVFNHISYVDLWWEAVNGKLKTVDLLFWLTATVFWQYATVKVLESRKWR
jgi:ABC-2 type transport system permease protein